MQLVLGGYKFEHHFLDYFSPFHQLLTTGLTKAGWENSHSITLQILQLNGYAALCFYFRMGDVSIPLLLLGSFLGFKAVTKHSIEKLSVWKTFAIFKEGQLLHGVNMICECGNCQESDILMNFVSLAGSGELTNSFK